MGGGPFPVLIQPNELIVIGGAAVGSVLSSAPGKARGRLLAALKRSFKDSTPTKQDYLDLLKLLYELFGIMRREGILALENHVNERDKSPLFAKYPNVTKRHHALDFLVEGLKQLVDGCPASDLSQLFDAELETHHEEQHAPVALLRGTGDALPGLGIVAAVLGIVITMAHLDGGPEEIGHHVAAALVGTFLGILLCYGLLQPIANCVETQETASAKYLKCIKEGVVASLRGAAPIVAVEFARKAIFSADRPSSDETDAACREVKAAGGG